MAITKQQWLDRIVHHAKRGLLIPYFYFGDHDCRCAVGVMFDSQPPLGGGFHNGGDVRSIAKCVQEACPEATIEDAHEVQDYNDEALSKYRPDKPSPEEYIRVLLQLKAFAGMKPTQESAGKVD